MSYGEILVSQNEFLQKLKTIKAFVFDWDGVFNDGSKHASGGSAFSEADSMGTNMLRFSYWLQKKSLPFTFIVSGANNPTAIAFAQREHFSGAIIGSKNKIVSFDMITKQFQISWEEMAFVYDDILDLGAAEKCGLKICIKREASPEFEAYVRDKNLADYISNNEGGRHAVREVCELLMKHYENYSETVSLRASNSAEYAKYLIERNNWETVLF